VDDRAEVELLGGEQREAGRQVEAHLPPEHAERAHARAVAALSPIGQDVGQEVEVLPLRVVRVGLVAVGDGNGCVHCRTGSRDE